MSNDLVITVVGNITADPELRFTQSGLPVANFAVASTPKKFNRANNEWEDTETLFLRCSIWREYAEHVAASLHKGDRVIVSGRLEQKNYETEEGERRVSYELAVDEVGPALRYSTAEVSRVPRAAQVAADAA